MCNGPDRRCAWSRDGRRLADGKVWTRVRRLVSVRPIGSGPARLEGRRRSANTVRNAAQVIPTGGAPVAACRRATRSAAPPDARGRARNAARRRMFALLATIGAPAPESAQERPLAEDQR